MCSLYRMVVFPAASSPSITTRISLFPNSLSNACLNDLNTVCADGAFPIAAGRFRRRTRATDSPPSRGTRPVEETPESSFPPRASRRTERFRRACARAWYPDRAGSRARQIETRWGNKNACSARDSASPILSHLGVDGRVFCRRDARRKITASQIWPGWVIAHTSLRFIFPPPHSVFASADDRGVQVVVASRAVPTPVARVPRAFPTPETPASVSRRFRRDRDATASVDRDGASTRASLDDADVGFRVPS